MPVVLRVKLEVNGKPIGSADITPPHEEYGILDSLSPEKLRESISAELKLPSALDLAVRVCA